MEKPFDLAARLLAEHIATVTPAVRNVRSACAYTVSVPVVHASAEVEAVRIGEREPHRIVAVAIGPMAWSVPETPAQRAMHAEIEEWIEANRPALNMALDAHTVAMVNDWAATLDDGTNHDSLDADFRDGMDE